MRGRNTPLLTVEIPQLQDVKVCLGTKANTEKITPIVWIFEFKRMGAQP